MPRRRRPDIGRRSQSNARQAASRANRTDKQRQTDRENSRIAMSELRYLVSVNEVDRLRMQRVRAHQTQQQQARSNENERIRRRNASVTLERAAFQNDPAIDYCADKSVTVGDEEAGICDDNMDDAEDDSNTLVESNVCRVCLAMDVKMYDLKDTELRGMFQNVTGICVPENNHSILERLCWECVGRLKTAAAFRNKALVSDILLQGLASTGEQIRKNDITTIKENKEYLRPAGTLSVVEVFHAVDIDPKNDSEPHILENNDTNIVEHTVGKDSYQIKKENIIDEDSDQIVIKEEPMIEFPIKTETEYDQFEYLCPNTGEDSRNVFTETNPLVSNIISLSENKINLPVSSPLPGCSHADPKYPVVGSLQNTLNVCKDKINRNAIVINKKDLNAMTVVKKPKVLESDKLKNINANIGGVYKKISIINKVIKTQVNTHTGEETHLQF